MRDETEHFGRREYRRKFQIDMPTDSGGYLGRLCPECATFFKLKSGTGIAEEHPQQCPACGHLAEQTAFMPAAHMDYARAYASRLGDIEDIRMVESMVDGVLKLRARRGQPPGKNDALLRRRVKPPPVPKLREPEIAERYRCPHCGLCYAVEVVPRACPDCGRPADPAAHRIVEPRPPKQPPEKKRRRKTR